MNSHNCFYFSFTNIKTHTKLKINMMGKRLNVGKFTIVC